MVTRNFIHMNSQKRAQQHLQGDRPLLGRRPPETCIKQQYDSAIERVFRFSSHRTGLADSTAVDVNINILGCMIV